MSGGYVLTITQLNRYAASLFTNDALLSNLTVRGEISGCKRHSSGHLYFSMKDDKALVRCVMFRQNAYTLDFEPEDGMRVTATGYVSLYEKDGQYQFYVKSMSMEGEGELYKRFLALKDALEAEGLFSQEHKIPLPPLPRCIGLITSGTGAAIQDMISVARRRFPMMNIAVCPVAVQGAGAAEEIASAIRLMNAKQAADVLIIGRGGGSIEELWAFNEEVTARAIYESVIPIVSAVGHETDFTIADFVADMRAPTPSAAAELCVPEYEALFDGVEALDSRMRDAALGTLAKRRQALKALTGSAGMAAPAHRLRLMREQLDTARGSMNNSTQKRADAASDALDKLHTRLSALSPDNVLKRGYALIRSNGDYISTAQELRKRDSADIILIDGTVSMNVNK